MPILLQFYLHCLKEIFSNGGCQAWNLFFDPLTNYFLHSFVLKRCRILLLIHFFFDSDHLLISFEMDQKWINVFKKWIEFHRIFKISEILKFIRVNVHFKPCSYQVSFRVGADRFPASNTPSWSKFSQCRLFISRTYLTSDPNRQYRSPILGYNSGKRFGTYERAKYSDHTELETRTA